MRWQQLDDASTYSEPLATDRKSVFGKSVTSPREDVLGLA
jgi:hypothetical protein